MRWLAACVIAMALTWVATATASVSRGFARDEFGFVNDQYVSAAVKFSGCLTPPAECSSSLSLLCEADMYAVQAENEYRYLSDLQRVLRKRGLYSRAEAAYKYSYPHCKSDPSYLFGLHCDFSDAVARAERCDRKGVLQALRKALAATEELDEPGQTTAKALVAFKLAWFGHAEEAYDALAPVLRLDRSRLSAGTRRSVSMAAAELGDFELAVALMPDESGTVAPLIIQAALEKGRRDVAVELARQLPQLTAKGLRPRQHINPRRAVIHAFIKHGAARDIWAAVESWSNATFEDFEQVAIGLTKENPAMALEMMVKHHPKYIASRLVKSAARAGNVDGALVLLRGSHGLAAYKKWGRDVGPDYAPEIYHIEAEVPLAHAIADLAEALAERGRRAEAFALLRGATDLFANSGSEPGIGWATGAIAIAYAHLGEPALGYAAVMRSREQTPVPLSDEEKDWNMGILVGQQALALSHKEDFATALALLAKYPTHRKDILEGFVEGAALDPGAPLPNRDGDNW